MVKERFAKIEELGEAWDDAPVRIPISTEAFILYEVEIQNDMLMWLMREAGGVEKSLDGLARRMLFLYLASIHSTSRVRRRTVHPKWVGFNSTRRRHPHKYCTAFFLTQSISSPSVKRSRLR
jgi:hypothetical protein